MTLRKQLQKTIQYITDAYFIDPISKRVGEREIPHWNSTLLAISYLLDQNMLLLGEPGFAKTTAAKVFASVMSGLPFDLYEAAQINGHPDQTYETMIARPDFGKLFAQQEEVIWLTSAYLPVRIVDEINRLPAGKQDELLTAIETGRFNYLNRTFFTTKSPFFATANHPDDGNHIMIPPLQDRFAVSTEIGYIGSLYHEDISDAKENIDDCLKDEKITTAILDIINDKTKSIKEKIKNIEEHKTAFALKLENELEFPTYSVESKKQFKKESKEILFSEDGKILAEMLYSELNTTALYGAKRSCDRVDNSNHAKALASTNVKNAFSTRGYDALRMYSRALAYILEEKQVTKKHIFAIAPHVLGHRLEFTDDYKSTRQDKRRPGQYGMPFEAFLAHELVKGVEANYAAASSDLKLLAAYSNNSTRRTLAPEDVTRVEGLLQDPDQAEHPLTREYLHFLRNGK